MMAGPDPETVVDLIGELIEKRLSAVIAGRALVLGTADEQAWDVAVKFLREAKAFAIAAEQHRKFAIAKWQAAENVLKGHNRE